MNKSSSLFFFIGTEAELIKLVPVLYRLQQKNIPFTIIASGQNSIWESHLFTCLGYSPEIILSKRRIQQTPAGLMSWFSSTLIRGLVSPFVKPKKIQNNGILLVHGDTISTLMGALIGRRCGMLVAHVEAGLRSFNFLHPFPEEICRVAVSKLARLHFCPNNWAAKNLKSKKVKGEVIVTKQNTLLDSLRFAVNINYESSFIMSLPSNFFIFVIHRQENLMNKNLLRSIIEMIVKCAEKLPCIFVLHAPTVESLKKNDLLAPILNNKNIITTPRMPYVEFMQTLNKCKFIVTDGGSNQEEAYYLGKPCLILRKHTERVEGLNENVLLSKNNLEILSRFLSNPGKWQRQGLLDESWPSHLIVDELEKRI